MESKAYSVGMKVGQFFRTVYQKARNIKIDKPVVTAINGISLLISIVLGLAAVAVSLPSVILLSLAAGVQLLAHAITKPKEVEKADVEPAPATC